MTDGCRQATQLWAALLRIGWTVAWQICPLISDSTAPGGPLHLRVGRERRECCGPAYWRILRKKPGCNPRTYDSRCSSHLYGPLDTARSSNGIGVRVSSFVWPRHTAGPGPRPETDLNVRSTSKISFRRLDHPGVSAWLPMIPNVPRFIDMLPTALRTLRGLRCCRTPSRTAHTHARDVRVS